MQSVDQNKLMLLNQEEFERRVSRVKAQMADLGIPAILISDNANKYYLTGRVYAGYVYIPLEGPNMFFVRRPVELEGDGVVYIRKPEEIGQSIGLNVPERRIISISSSVFTARARLITVEAFLSSLSGKIALRRVTIE